MAISPILIHKMAKQAQNKKVVLGSPLPETLVPADPNEAKLLHFLSQEQYAMGAKKINEECFQLKFKKKKVSPKFLQDVVKKDWQVKEELRASTKQGLKIVLCEGQKGADDTFAVMLPYDPKTTVVLSHPLPASLDVADRMHGKLLHFISQEQFAAAGSVINAELAKVPKKGFFGPKGGPKTGKKLTEFINQNVAKKWKCRSESDPQRQCLKMAFSAGGEAKPSTFVVTLPYNPRPKILLSSPLPSELNPADESHAKLLHFVSQEQYAGGAKAINERLPSGDDSAKKKKKDDLPAFIAFVVGENWKLVKEPWKQVEMMRLAPEGGDATFQITLPYDPKENTDDLPRLLATTEEDEDPQSPTKETSGEAQNTEEAEDASPKSPEKTSEPANDVVSEPAMDLVSEDDLEAMPPVEVVLPEVVDVKKEEIKAPVSLFERFSALESGQRRVSDGGRSIYLV